MAFVIALDIGGTNVRAALINDDYTISESVREFTIRHDQQIFIDQIIGVVNKLDNWEKASVIVAGVPGRVRKNGFIDELPNIGINNINLKDALFRAFKLPVFIHNDAEMAAYAEAKLGVGKKVKRTYFVTISTGIGGCLIEEGVIKNPSGEIGHTLVRYKDSYYELEKIASGDGLLKLCALNNVSYASAAAFFNDVSVGKPYALMIFNDWLTLMIWFFTYISQSFTPDVIAVTGGVSKASYLFWEKLTAFVPAPMTLAHFAEDAGLYGAAAFGFSQLA